MWQTKTGGASSLATMIGVIQSKRRAVLSISWTSAFQDSPVEEYYDYTQDDYRQTRPPIPVSRVTPKITARYEVEEIIDDIPNPNAGPFPIATNFTVNKPLNIAGNNPNQNIQNGAVNRDNPKFRKDFNSNNVGSQPFIRPNVPGPNTNNFQNPSIGSGNDYNNEKSPLFSVFNPDNRENANGQFPGVLPIIKDYLHGLEKGITQGLNQLVGKNVFDATRDNDDDDEDPLPVLFNKFKQNNDYDHHETQHSHSHHHEFIHF